MPGKERAIKAAANSVNYSVEPESLLLECTAAYPTSLLNLAHATALNGRPFVQRVEFVRCLYTIPLAPSGRFVATTQLALSHGNQIARSVNQNFNTPIPADFQDFTEINSNNDGIVAMGLVVIQGILA